MRNITAFLLALITLIAGVYIGYTSKDGINADILLAALMVGNALLTRSTIKSSKIKSMIKSYKEQ